MRKELQIKLLEHKPRTLEYQQNVNFANGPIVGYPKNFKSNEDIITKSK